MNEKVDATEYSKSEREDFHKNLYTGKPLLEVENLKKYYSKNSWFSKNDEVKAVDGVSFKIYEGETLGLVGESGCGKTTLGRTILHLEESSGGTIVYKGRDITRLNAQELKELRCH